MAIWKNYKKEISTFRFTFSYSPVASLEDGHTDRLNNIVPE